MRNDTKRKKIDIRERVRAAIKKSGMSVPAVARAAGLNQQTIYNFLEGRRRLRMDSLEAVIDALGLKLDL